MRPERFRRLRGVLARRQPDLTVLLDRVNKSHNLSAILRNCDAVGVLEAHVVPAREGLGVHHGTSAGTKKWVRVRHHATTEDAVQMLKRGGFTVVAVHPSATSVDFRQVDFTPPTAIMLGAELHGVSDEGLRGADVHARIPMRGMVHSLNVSVATALVLFEAARQRQDAGMYEESRLDAAEFRRLLFEWAYPSIAVRRRRAGRPYPELTDDGEIVRDE